MGIQLNETAYKELIRQDIQWLDHIMNEYAPHSLEGIHIRNILEYEIKKYDVQSTPAYDIVK